MSKRLSMEKSKENKVVRTEGHNAPAPPPARRATTYKQNAGHGTGGRSRISVDCASMPSVGVESARVCYVCL